MGESSRDTGPHLDTGAEGRLSPTTTEEKVHTPVVGCKDITDWVAIGFQSVPRRLYEWKSKTVEGGRNQRSRQYTPYPSYVESVTSPVTKSLSGGFGGGGWGGAPQD